jgi:hypothetical protein
MYDAYKPLKKILKGHKNPWTKHVKEVFTKYKEGDPKDFSSFKVFFRSFKVIRPDLYEYKPLYAKDMLLEYDEGIPYPEDCISYSQRKKFKTKYLKQQKKS